jgi:CARDB
MRKFVPRGFVPIACGLAVMLNVAAHAREPAQDPAGPDLAVIVKVSPLLTVNQDVKISTTVKNEGLGPAAESEVEIIIKNGHAPRQVVRTVKRKIRGLTAGDSFTFSFSVKLNPGLYEICGTADRKKKLPDPDRKNNVFCLLTEGR